MALRVFPGRCLYQCYLWDCARGNQHPYCDIHHETYALEGDLFEHAIVFVDGLDKRHRETLTFKVLTCKALNVACGIPSLDVEVIRSMPWENDMIDMDLELRENNRSWVFLSENVRPGPMWFLRERGLVFGFRFAVYYLHPNPVIGRFKLFRYTSPFHDESLFCLHFERAAADLWENKFRAPAHTDNAQNIETRRATTSCASTSYMSPTASSHMSPAFADPFVGYQFMRLKASDKQEWVVPLKSIEDVNEQFRQLCLGNIKSSPWSELDGLQPETQIINEKLGQINSDGFLTINSQPSVNGAPSATPGLGWDCPGGYVYQKAYLEFFCSEDKLDKFVEMSKAFPSVTYMAVNKAGDWVSNIGSDVNTVTWGVFPAKDILQPTVIDPASFKVWKDEAFEIWSRSWANLYPEDDPSRKVLEEVKNSYYLVSLVDNDYVSGDIFNLFECSLLHTETESPSAGTD